MQLLIEPPEARTESYSGSRVTRPGGDIRVLDLVVQPQQLSKWCWAAIAASLGAYYGTGRWQQHEVASALLGVDCSRFREDSTIAGRCDTGALLSEALQVTGCYSHWSPGRPMFERLQTEIDAGRPIAVHIDWHQGEHIAQCCRSDNERPGLQGVGKDS